MRIHLDTIRGSRDVEHRAKACLYRNCPSKGVWARLAAAPVGIASEGLGLATRVATTGEAVLKGSLNILGSPWRSDCSLRRGLHQLFFSATKSLIIIPFFPLIAIVRIAKTTLLMVLTPEELVKERILRHNPTEYYEAKVSKIFLALHQRASSAEKVPIAVTSYMLYARPSLIYYYMKIAEIERSTPLVAGICREIAKVYSEMPAFETKRFKDYNAGCYFENRRIASSIENQEAVLTALIKLEPLYTKLNIIKFEAVPTTSDQRFTPLDADSIEICKNSADTFYLEIANQEGLSAFLDAGPKLRELRENYDRLRIHLANSSPCRIRRYTDILTTLLSSNITEKNK